MRGAHGGGSSQGARRLRFPLRACSVLPQSIWIEGIEGVSIPSKLKSPSNRINPLQSIWIENNRRSP
jgi:hypothetical protein